jgi:FAD/FMN-containing dehydrogenase
MIATQLPKSRKIGGEAAFASLRAALHGELILPGDAEYNTARRVWNAAIDRHPAVIIRCTHAHDVQCAVKFARESGLDVAVRGGGHSFPGFSTCDDGLVIDLSPMKTVSVNPDNRTARAGAGVTLGELIQATEEYGLVTNTGTQADTGIAGLTLGGGIGWLMGKYGLTCDNVRSFEVVTADGSLLRANADENSDLFWGLRGGGGNFGIVTAFEYLLHPLKQILGGMVAHPLSRARSVLEFYRELTYDMPDELTTACMIFTGPDGKPAIGVAACCCGDVSEGKEVIAPLRKFGSPFLQRFEPMPYSGLFSLFGPPLPNQRSYHMKGSGVPVLSDGAIDAILDSAESITSPFSQILLFTVHGAAARVGATETAFSLREEHVEIMHLAAWENDDAERHVQWSRQSWRAMQAFASSRAYVNFLDLEGTSRVRTAYGPNYERLVALKTKYDPNNLFHLNQNIKPNAHSDARAEESNNAFAQRH